MGMWIARLILATLLASGAGVAAELIDIDGVRHGSLESPPGKATVVFFVLRDCPISNQFAPEINRICNEYAANDVRCFLAYLDPDAAIEDVRRHTQEFSYACCPAILDESRRLTKAAGATITPEAALFSSKGELMYRGRINNLYAGLGKKRRQPTVHDLRKALDEALAGAPVSTARTQAIGCYAPPARPGAQ